MKKILLVPFIICGMAISCTENLEPKTTADEILVAEAMSHFSSVSNNQLVENKNARLKGDRHALLKSAVWKSAYYQNLSFGKALIVPVRFDQELFYKPDANDLKLPISGLTFLLFYKSELKKINMEVITCLPTFDIADSVQNQAFKGNVLVENWSGELLTGYIFSDGKTYKTLPTSQKSKNGRMVAECTTTDWYTCTSSVTYGTNCTYDYSETYCTYSEDGGGSATGGGSPSSGGGGGGGSGSGGSSADYNTIATVTNYVVPGVRGNLITEVNKYLECLDSNNPATITIYVDQPVPGKRSTNAGTDVGHTFIGIEQKQNNGTITVSRIFGFYPKGELVTPANPIDDSSLGNDSGHTFDVSISVKVTPEKLKEVISYIINNTPKKYNLNTFNCSSFGISIGNICGLDLPNTTSCWTPGIGGCGNNPGDLGEDLKSKTGVNVKTNSTAPKTSGCLDIFQ
jgi:hypothetical protein